MDSREKDNKKEIKSLLVRSLKNGSFFEKEGFKDLGGIVKYAVEKSMPR